MDLVQRSKHPVVINTFADSLTNCFWNLENVPFCTTPYMSMSTKHQCNAPLNISTMPSSAINTLDNLRAMVLFLSSSGSACATLYCEMRASQRLTLFFFLNYYYYRPNCVFISLGFFWPPPPSPPLLHLILLLRVRLRFIECKLVPWICECVRWALEEKWRDGIKSKTNAYM